MRNKQIKKSAIFACAVLIFAVAVNLFAAQSDWNSFWTKFKAAVAKNDKATVLSLSKEKLSDANYKNLFGIPARRSCFAKAEAVKDERGNYSVFCGEQGYLFEKVDGQFKFIEAFAND